MSTESVKDNNRRSDRLLIWTYMDKSEAHSLLIAPNLTWVGDHQQDCFGAVLDDVGDDELEDVDVALHQVQAALTLLLAGTGGHDHHPGISCHTVVW